MDYRSQYSNLVKTPNGKLLNDFSQGGLVKGQTHSQGGIPTYKMQDGGQMPMEGMEEMPQEPEQIAEVEGAGVSEDGIAVDGGERIFSVEDTQVMEQMAMQYAQSQDQNVLLQLGLYVVDSITKQEQVNPSGSPMGELEPELDPSLMTPQAQEMMKNGGKMKKRNYWE